MKVKMQNAEGQRVVGERTALEECRYCGLEVKRRRMRYHLTVCPCRGRRVRKPR